MEKNANRQEARRKYWASISKEERSKRARKMARAKADKMTPEERSEHGKMMIKARYNKK